VTSKDSTTCNGFGFKGGRGTHTECVVAHPTTLSPFSLDFLCDRKKLSQLCLDGIYSCVQGVVCAHFEGILLFNEVM